eukprot:m.16238 g.16238  ORF g.16238 m.16238 type:complete len:463 (+) comp5625_c0_seq2:25-1413(+)
MAHTRMLFVLFSLVVGAQANKPNIVWIMSDDLGAGEVGIFPGGSDHGRISTPNLDKFGQEGMKFMNAYAGYTVCAPSRTTLFTGRHSGNFHKYGLAGTDIPTTQNVLTTSEMLQKAGYVTGAFGKTAPLGSPIEQGFDSFLGQINQGACHNMYPKQIDVKNSTMELPANSGQLSRNITMANPDKYNYTIDMFQAAAETWLHQVAGGPKPFFMYLSFTVPHAGGWEEQAEQGQPVPSDGQYASESWPDVEKDHAAVITYLDTMVGRVMASLQMLNVDNNTLVFFASDNGAHNEGGHNHLFFNSTGGLRGFKRSLYEGGVRSPSMARWPGVIAPGTVSDFMWAFWDVMPTLADITGGTPADNIDGVSFLDTLKGNDQPARKYLFHTWTAKPKGYGVRMGNFKGVVNDCGKNGVMAPQMSDTMEVYDLTKDPFETNDISSSSSEWIQMAKTFLISQNLTCYCFQC